MIFIYAVTVVIYTAWVLFLQRELKRQEAKARFWKDTATEVVDQFAYYIPDPETGCWVWQKGKDPRGYGRVNRKNYGTGLAHRVYYERLHGPIAPGLHLDHLCCNTSCVNPDHLEPVSAQENNRRWRERSPEQAAQQWELAKKARHQ